MRPAVLVILTVICLGFTGVCGASGEVLSPSDFIVNHISGQAVELGMADQPAESGCKADYMDGRLVSLTIYGSEYETSRGLRIGDPGDKITKLYGEPWRSGEETGYRWQSYRYKDDGSSLKVFFYLDKQRNSVIAMNFNLFPTSALPRVQF